MGSEVAAKASFREIRYAQCWEDADILLEALDIQPDDVCLSVASAGDNTLALLTGNPARVIALDLSPAQLACLELRIAAYRNLSHPELLELIGSVPSSRRVELYQLCRSDLSAEVQQFWDSLQATLSQGIGAGGKFERYFAKFRHYILPLVQSRKNIDRLLRGGTREERLEFYHRHWDTWSWRLLFRIFFSRFVMGRLGRDPAFFSYVKGSVSSRILERTKHALTELNPADNPYLQWILKGQHTTALPLALRPEHFDTIRSRLDRVEWHARAIEDFLDSQPSLRFSKLNLSDIFEYMSEENYRKLLERLAAHGRAGGRLAYWNMLAPRSRPEGMADRLRPLEPLAEKLHFQDKAFFYSRFVVEEIL